MIGDFLNSLLFILQIKVVKSLSSNTVNKNLCIAISSLNLSCVAISQSKRLLIEPLRNKSIISSLKCRLVKSNWVIFFSVRQSK